MRQAIRRILRSAMPVAVLLVLATAASACPTCKDAIAANDPQHQSMVQGYFYSILFMMAMPFVLIGTFSGYMYLEVRRARAAEQDEHDAR